ncbi:MAG TPA: PDZ domain-containing protein [Planctomycetota bacterium]
MKVAAILLLFLSAAPALAQEDPYARLAKRVERELKEALQETRTHLREFALSELARAGNRRNLQFDLSLIRFIERLPDNGLEGRLKKYLRTEEGRRMAADLFAQSGYDTLEEAVEHYFEADKDGRLRIREELEEGLEQLLETVAPKESQSPKAAPPSGKKAFLGFKPDPLTDPERRELGIAAPKGVKSWEIVEGSPAEKAGMETGDVLLSIGGKELTAANVDEVMGSFKPGAEVDVVYFRGRAKRSVKVVLGSR